VTRAIRRDSNPIAARDGCAPGSTGGAASGSVIATMRVDRTHLRLSMPSAGTASSGRLPHTMPTAARS
jgi:hypothetical protein